MIQELQDEYEEIQRKLLAKRGRFVRDADARGLYYGWTDYEALDHTRPYKAKATPCRVTVTGPVKETYWDEFAGTFYEGDESHHGIEAIGSCACGKIKDRRIRYETSVGDAIREFFEAMNEIKAELADDS